MGCSVGAVSCTSSPNVDEGFELLGQLHQLEIFLAGLWIHTPKPSSVFCPDQHFFAAFSKTFSPLRICTAKYLLVALSSLFSI